MNIQNLINPLLVLEVINNRITLKEPENIGRELTLQDVTITDLPDGTIAYSTDVKLEDNTSRLRNLYNEYLNVPSPLLMQQDRKHWINGNEYEHVERINKRSDGVLIFRNGNEISIIICDLKSKEYNLKDCSDKFITDKLLIDYLISILNIIFKENILRITVKYVVFFLKKGIKTVIRTTPESLEQFKNRQMEGYQESIMEIPLPKLLKNEIKWSKIIDHQ